MANKETEINWFEEGRKACRIYYSSQAYSSSSKNITADAAIRIFLPPVEEALVQISMPLPKKRQKWLLGFKKEQPIILAEHEVNCKECGQLLPKEKS